MVKSKKHITDSNKETSKATHKEVVDTLTRDKMVYTIPQIERLAEEAREYCLNEKRCLKITQFVRSKNLYYETWMDWTRKYDWFAKNHRECLAILGDKREVGASFKELDKDMQLKVLHRYDPEWKEINEYHSKLKDDQKTADANVIKEVLESVLKPYDEKK